MLTPDTPRFVAHFDMLGMSYLSKNKPDIAWEMLSKLDLAKEERLSLVIERVDNGELIEDQIRAFTFSDTIIAFSKGNYENDAIAMFILAVELFHKALHYCIPLRGGIALGQFWVNEASHLFSGPALIDAYEIGESSQWIGISLQDDAAKAFSKTQVAISPRGRKTLVPWQVPQKNGSSKKRMIINWPETHVNNWTGPVPLTIDVFYRQFEEAFGPYDSLSDAVKAKYVNTVSFFNANYLPLCKQGKCP